MATVNFIPCKKQNAFSMRNEIEYILQNFKVCIEPEKFNCDHTVNYQTYSGDADKTGCIRLISGKDCCPETAFQEFMATKNSYKKADQTMFYHYDQAFKDGETISPKTAHEIAIKFAEDNYPDFEVVIATHVDNEHLHSHFIINSVSFKTGKKLHQGPQTLLKLRAYSDHICQQYGLTTLEPYNGGKSKSLAAREYRAAAKGQSWKFSLMNTIDTAMKTSGTKAEFIKNMERQGYSIRWESSRKYITYTCPNTMSCRDTVLQKELETMRKRDLELTSLFKRLYEDNVLGRIPDEHYRTLSDEYTTEQKALRERIPKSEARMDKFKNSLTNVDRFIEKAKKYTDLTDLTPELLRMFIAKVVVGEKAEKYSRTAPQDIWILYRDIGMLNDVKEEFDIPSMEEFYGMDDEMLFDDELPAAI